jgi:hypothetical protein
LAFFQTFYTLLAEEIEKLKFADETPCVLYNPESFTDVLVSYEDPSRIVGIVDWEGACLLPMWHRRVLFNDGMLHDFFRDESMIEKWSEFREGMSKAHGVSLLDHLNLDGETWRIRRNLMWFMGKSIDNVIMHHLKWWRTSLWRFGSHGKQPLKLSLSL